jgi:periplasmic mercuric ion binding protein
MKLLQITLLAACASLFFNNCTNAQNGMVKKTATATASLQTETFQVLGNCGMCKKTIEKAAAKAGTATANWDVDKDLLTVSFDPAKTSADAVQKSVAQAGYDNVGYKAPDAAYNGLHGCCQYDRSGAPSSAKSCEAEN